MNNDKVFNELVKLNSGVADIAYAGEHIWHSVKVEYAELIGKLSDFVKTEICGNKAPASGGGGVFSRICGAA